MEANYANEDGPDLTNKIEYEADLLENEDGYENKSHDEIVKELRKKHITSEEPITHECYLNIENPYYVGENETILFEDLADNVGSVEDYDSEEEYYKEIDASLEYNLGELVDEVLSELDSRGYDNYEEISGLLYDSAYNRTVPKFV